VNRGILSGLGAYLIWGFIPVYFKLLQAVPAVEIMFHRVIWSLILLMALIMLRQQWVPLRQALRQPRLLGIYSLSAVLLAANWWIYIYGVNAGQVVETSLGYFINPLLSVALGVIFLGERPRPLQWLPVGLATLGVLYLTLQYGRLPWIALSLAFSFGFYGLIKKVAPLGSLHGLTLETFLLSLPALGYLLALEFSGRGIFLHTTWENNLLLVLVGVVTADVRSAAIPGPHMPISGGSPAVQRTIQPRSDGGLWDYLGGFADFLGGEFIELEANTREINRGGAKRRLKI